MDPESGPGSTAAGREQIPPVPRAISTTSLESLVTSTRELYVETSAQVRDIGELAFMELELAIRSLQWGIWALLMFGACSVLACTFLMVATALLLVNSSVSPAVIMLFCGGFSAIAAGFLYLCLRSLTKKMTFTHLRSHLTQLKDATRVKS